MITIYKYELDNAFGNTGLIDIETYAGAIPLHVDHDPRYYDTPTALRVWMEVNTTNPKVIMKFKVMGTGHKMPEGWLLANGFVGKHVGSAVIPPYAWHVYLLTTEEPSNELPAG